jgi:phosphopentomutase
VRTFLIVCDSLGVGALPDAGRHGESGCHTLDHLVAAAGLPEIPRLLELGLGCVPGVRSLPRPAAPEACYGRMAERSPGKDTSTGHWEMLGCVLEREFPVHPDGFPPAIIDEFVRRSGLPGVLCNRPASGTEVLERLGAEHVRSGKPIVYTSADSVFQIAAHEQHFGLQRLYDVCEVARAILTPHGIGRVIARPFVGEPGSYKRTYNRRDYSLEPPCETGLDRLARAGVPVVGVGKISDIYAGRGVTESIHTEGNRDGMRALQERARTLEHGLLFINLVDFDMLYGHRRDAVGYRRALEEFDTDLRELERELRPGDAVMISADHGNDPTYTQTTDHTREYVPLLVYGPGCRAGVELGTRATFADLGASVEEALGLAPVGPGRSFWKDVARP